MTKVSRGWLVISMAALLSSIACGSKSEDKAKAGTKTEIKTGADEPTANLTKTPTPATEKAEVSPPAPPVAEAAKTITTSLAEMETIAATLASKKSGNWKRMHKSVQSGRAAYQRAQFGSLVFAGQRGWALAPKSRAAQEVMLTTDDGGATWTRAKAGIPLSVIDVLNDKHGMSMDATGAVAFTADGGKTWTPTGSGRLQRLLRFHLVDADRSIAIINDQLKQSSDRGKTWRGFFMPSYGFLRFVNVAGDGTTWAIGLRSNKLAVWKRGPAADADWGEVFSLAKDKRLDPYGVAFHGDNAMWIVGDDMLVFTHDSGKSWKRVDGLWPNKMRLHAVHFADLERGWVAGYSFDDKASFLLHTTDGGKTWAPQAIKAGKQEVLTGLTSHGDELWVYGQALYKRQR